MSKKPTTFGLEGNDLARLLSIGDNFNNSENEIDCDKKMSDCLHDRLQGTLPFDPEIIEALPVILGRACQELLPLAGKSIGDLLLDSKTHITTIKKLRIMVSTWRLR